jgi:hypothetical protein
MKVDRVDEVLKSNFGRVALGAPKIFLDYLYNGLYADVQDLVIEDRLRTINLLELKGVRITKEQKSLVLGS